MLGVVAGAFAVDPSVAPAKGDPPGSAPPARSATPRAPQRPSASSSTPAAPRPASPELIRDRDGSLRAVVYPPKDLSAPKPIAVMLHGMCDEPTNECPYFAPSVTRTSWLVCPRGSARCAHGGFTWDGRTSKTVQAAVDAVAARWSDRVDTRAARMLIGFSLGGIVGMDLAHHAGGRYASVLLIGAKVFPDPARLERQGVQRLVLAAGAYDMMYGHMSAQARKCERGGFPTRFVNLGPVGHTFPPDFDAILRPTLDWMWQGDKPVS